MHCARCGRAGDLTRVATVSGGTNQRSRRGIERIVAWVTCRNRRCGHSWWSADAEAVAQAQAKAAEAPASEWPVPGRAHGLTGHPQFHTRRGARPVVP